MTSNGNLIIKEEVLLSVGVAAAQGAVTGVKILATRQLDFKLAEINKRLRDHSHQVVASNHFKAKE